MQDEFFLTNLELRESTPTGEETAGLSHASMAGLFLLQVLELAARGEPRGAVTVVHDAGDHGGRYRELANHLAGAGWAIALPDMRGHGGSEGERGHGGGIDEAVRDLAAVQDHLAYRMPDAPKVLVGQGLGALWSAAFAIERPGVVQALVLVAPLHEPSFQLPAPAKGLSKLFKKVGPMSPGQIGWTAEQLTSDTAAASAYAADTKVHDVITLHAGNQAAEAARRFLPRLAEAGVPTLVLHGSEDPISSVEASRALASASVEVTTFDGLRHQPLHESRAAEVQAALTTWLDGQLPR